MLLFYLNLIFFMLKQLQTGKNAFNYQYDKKSNNSADTVNQHTKCNSVHIYLIINEFDVKTLYLIDRLLSMLGPSHD